MSLYRLEYFLDTLLKKKFNYDFEKPVIVDFERIEKELIEKQFLLDSAELVRLKLYKIQKRREPIIVYDESKLVSVKKLSKRKSKNLRKKYELSKVQPQT